MQSVKTAKNSNILIKEKLIYWIVIRHYHYALYHRDTDEWEKEQECKELRIWLNIWLSVTQGAVIGRKSFLWKANWVANHLLGGRPVQKAYRELDATMAVMVRWGK